MNEQVLLDKVYDAGANTIWSEMKKLRGQAPENKNNMRRRWVWELIQNASDCAPRSKGVDINVILDSNNHQLQFTHNGKPFKYGNIIDLITQISSKQSDDEDTTGKFGTGFISTHLLSETVKIESILHDENNVFKNLKFTIDRSGVEYHDIRENIKRNLTEIEDIRNANVGIIVSPIDIKTTFTYFLENDDANQAVLVGLDDLRDAAPFVLALNQSINSINCNGILYIIESRESVLDEEFHKVVVKSSLNEKFTLLCKTNDNVTTLFLVNKISHMQYELLPYPENLPKLFCNFPLIGTEKFSFPVIINCADFEVEKDRNAIHEGNAQNIGILQTAKTIYSFIIDFAAKNHWENTYNLCLCNKNNVSQLQLNLYEDFYKKIRTLPIVDVNLSGDSSGKVAFSIYKGASLENQIWIPKTDKEDLDDEFWEIINSFSRFYIPTKNTYKEWRRVHNNKITIQNINMWFLKEKTFADLHNKCHSGCEIYAWLNSYYALWVKIVDAQSFKCDAWVLNQSLKFVPLLTLFKDGNIDEELKIILVELGENINDYLISREIIIPTEVNVASKDNNEIAKRIQDRVNKLLSEETVNNVKREQKTQMTFNKITNWFLINPDKGAEIFTTLYNKRNMLSTIEENIRRFRIAEKVESKNISDIELDSLLDNHTKIFELLAKCDGLSAEEIKQELQHISSHNKNAYEYYRAISERTIRVVHQYLLETGLYDIPDNLEQWYDFKYSSTVFPAKKDGKDIRIVVRPSDYNKIIFYYDEELDALDDTDYELWTDDGNGNTRIITLGDIIKTTGISVIPLRKFYKQ